MRERGYLMKIEMTETGWIDVEKELPPCDGMYEVTDKSDSMAAEGCLFYDGIGFLLLSAYRPVKFWRHHKPIIKRYGKQDENRAD